jgi:hypothetical protein
MEEIKLCKDCKHIFTAGKLTEDLCGRFPSPVNGCIEMSCWEARLGGPCGYEEARGFEKGEEG